MSEKQFPATPKRRQEARKKGQIFKSQELNSALMLLAFVALMKYWMIPALNQLAEIFQYVYAFPSDWSPVSVTALMLNLMKTGLQIIAPVFAVGIFLAVFSNFLQVRALFSFEPLKPQLSRISLVSGAKRMFGVRAWVELGKALLKVIAIGYFLYAAIRDNLQIFPALQQLDVRQGAVFLGNAIQALAWKISLAFLGIALFDYVYQWWDYEKNLRMSHEEMKEEFKQTEGNPQVRAEIKRKQRIMAMRRMMQELPKADVVVTNPTHFAVALRYNAQEKTAPYVVAKGQDEIALKIKELAKEHKIAVIENKPLARALYQQVDIGQVVPADLYKAVAEVLAFVYRMKKKKRLA